MSAMLEWPPTGSLTFLEGTKREPSGINGLQPYGYCASMEPTQATNVQHQLHNPAVYM